MNEQANYLIDPDESDDPNDPNFPDRQAMEWALRAVAAAEASPENSDVDDPVFNKACTALRELASKMGGGNLTGYLLRTSLGRYTAEAIVKVVIENFHRIFQTDVEFNGVVEANLAYWRFRYLARQMDIEV